MQYRNAIQKGFREVEHRFLSRGRSQSRYALHFPPAVYTCTMFSCFFSHFEISLFGAVKKSNKLRLRARPRAWRARALSSPMRPALSPFPTPTPLYQLARTRRLADNICCTLHLPFFFLHLHTLTNWLAHDSLSPFDQNHEPRNLWILLNSVATSPLSRKCFE